MSPFCAVLQISPIMGNGRVQVVSLRQRDAQYNAKLRKQEEEYKKLQTRIKVPLTFLYSFLIVCRD